MSTTVTLTNTNFMTKPQYDGMAPANNEIYNVDIDTDSVLRNKVLSWIAPNMANGVTTSNNFTAPTNGWWCVETNDGGDGQSLTINGTTFISANTYGRWMGKSVFLKKGDVAAVKKGFQSATFFPCVGV